MAILIAEPEDADAQRILAGLTTEGFTCTRVRDGAAALAQASDHDLLVTELLLPGLTGLDVIRRLRERRIATPVICLSKLGTPEDRVRGLEAGADDYLAKPFTLAELAARIRAVLRRSQLANRSLHVKVADLVWDPQHRRIVRCGRRLDLTPKEYALAALLLEHRGQVVSRDQMAQTLWSLDPDRGIGRSANALDVQVRRLRAKLDDPFRIHLLHTQRGIGLVLEAREP